MGKKLLVLANNYPNKDNSYVEGIFVKEQIEQLKNHFDVVYVISPVAHGVNLIRRIKQNNYSYDNVEVFYPKYINFPIFWYVLKNLWINFEARAVNKLIFKEKLTFSIIHAHFSWPSGAVAVKIKTSHTVPVVITEHTSNYLNCALENNDMVWIRTWKMADKIIRVNKADIPKIIKRGIPEAKIIHIPNGFNKRFHPMSKTQCRNKLGLPLDKKILLCVANMHSHVKGHSILIDSFNYLTKRRSDTVLVLVGQGKLEKEIRERVKMYNLEDLVFFAGGRSHNEIPYWMNASDLFVLPSIQESFGVVQVEAMACGLPVIATRNGGSDEIIQSDELGCLANTSDYLDLARKILYALEKTWDFDHIIKYSERFEWKKIGKSIIEVYDSVLE